MKKLVRKMRIATAGTCLVGMAVLQGAAWAQTLTVPYMPEDASGSEVPEGVAQFAVDPFWPKPLPNNWIIGQVAGTAVDLEDNVWIIYRPSTVQGTHAG